jgi:ADP-heptose:LPS heptosyltransferase
MRDAPRKILIVNLTRFGDLLQTSPTIAGLKELHPAAEVVAVVERNFADVARGLPGIDRVWELDLDRLGKHLLGPTGADLREAYRSVEETVQRLRAERFDLALNYSSSRMSAVFLKLVDVPDTRGWTMTTDGYRKIAHPWSRLFSASCLVRQHAPFNLVDYYKRVAGVTRGPRKLFFTVPEPARAEAAAFLDAAGVDANGTTPLVALQLGASRPIRRWPAAHWIALARLLAERIGARVVLCGGAGDRDVAGELAAALGPLAVDACGKTSIATLGALLARCDVLVTPDTGPMHMAVAVGTPVVSLFFGPAIPFDTGPYAPDHLCLTAEVPCGPCDHNVTCLEPFCRDTLPPEAVAEATILRRAAEWRGLSAAADRWPAFAWYRTGFDAEGFADVTRLGSAPRSRREQVRRAYRALWKAVLDGTPPVLDGPALADQAAVVRGLVPLVVAGVRHAAAVEALAAGAPEPDLVELEHAARRLEEHDLALYRYGAMHEPTTLLLQLFRFEKESLDGGDVGAIARRSRVLHEELETRARLLADLLDPSTAPARASDHGGQHASLS